MRHRYAPRLEPTVQCRLDELAAEQGLRYGQYLGRVVVVAHDFTNRFLPAPQLAPLRFGVSVAELQAATQAIDCEQCLPVLEAGAVSGQVVLVDIELAEWINARCDELGVAYAAYFRAVFRAAAGVSLESMLPPGNQARIDIGGVDQRRRRRDQDLHRGGRQAS